MQFRDFVPQEWVRERLKIYELLKKLREDKALREKWIRTEIWKRKQEDPSIDGEYLAKLINDYLNVMSFHVTETHSGKTTVRIRPKVFNGKSYRYILGMDFRHLSSAVKVMADTAIQDILRGYGKAGILKGLFGEEFSERFNALVKDRMGEEFNEQGQPKGKSGY